MSAKNFHIKRQRVMKCACYVEIIGKMINALTVSDGNPQG
jgi:hypothetical protein